MTGRWQLTPASVAAARAALDALRAGRQLRFDFEREPAPCEACDDDLEHDCARCHGQGCQRCDAVGRVDCACQGGQALELDEDDPLFAENA